MNRRIKRIALAFWLVIALVCAPRLTVALSYFVEGQTQYEAASGGQCTSLADVNLNDPAAQLVPTLSAAGWSGMWFEEPSAWPQDYWESGCTSLYGLGGQTYNVVGGLDTSYADTANLVVFVGHGGPNWEIFSRMHNGECTHNTTVHTRLGEWGGYSAAVAIWASCSMLASATNGSTQDVQWQGLRQQFGFAQEATIYDNDLRDFFNATSTKTNAQAWIDQFPAGRGDPTVVTNSHASATDCWANMWANQIKNGTGLTPIGPGAATCGGWPNPTYTCVYHRGN
jgi:hypothetical protein